MGFLYRYYAANDLGEELASFPFTLVIGILEWDWHILKGTSSNYFYQELLINMGKE